MPSSYIYKAEGERGKRGIFLTPQEDPRSTPVAVLSDGRRIEGRYINTNEGRNQYNFGDDILGQQGVKIEYMGKTIDLEDSNKSYEGNNPFDGWQYRNKGDLGSGGGSGGGGGFPGSFAPFDYGAGQSPAYLGGQYPFFQPINYINIPNPDYELLDPEEFGTKFGDFTRNELTKNFGTSKKFALEALDMELQNIKGFVPALSTLKRTETAIDNIFNQSQRTAQINATLPDVQRGLKAQTDRAQALAEGRLPDAIEDEALSVAIRSEAADAARVGGFGSNSAVGRNLSNRMSARERLAISQYGDQLITSNAVTRANFELAPTSYSDAGQQVNVNPQVSPAQLTSNYLSLATQVATIPAQVAFQGIVGQRQFGANLTNNVNQFNATNRLNTDMFNAENVYASQLGFFNYNQGFAANLAGLGTAEINQQREDSIRESLTEAFEESMGDSQNRQTAIDILSALGKVPALFGVVKDVLGAFGVDYSNTDTNTTDEILNPDLELPLGAIGQNSDGSYIYPDSSYESTDSVSTDEVVGTTPEGYDIYEMSYSPPDKSLDVFGVTRNGYSLGVDLDHFKQAMGFV